MQNPLRYPARMLPARMATFIHKIMAHRDAPADLVAPVVLSAVAAAVQGVIDVRLPYRDVVPTSLWTLIIGESGIRASPVLRTIKMPFERFENSDFGQPFHQFLVEAATDSGVTKIFQDGARSIFLASDEGSTVLPKMNMPSMCKRFDGDTERHNTLSKGAIALQGRRTSMCILIQQSAFKRFMTKREEIFIESGAAGRFLVSAPLSTEGYRVSGDIVQETFDPSADPFSKQIENILLAYQIVLDDPKLRAALYFSKEAESIWWAFEKSIEEGLRPGGWWTDVRVFAAKAAQIAGRIAAALQFFETRSTEISPWAAHAGCAIAHWHLNEAKRLFGEASYVQTLENDACVLLKKILHLRASGYYPLRKSLLMRLGPPHLRKREALDAPLSILVQRGIISITGTGRTEIIQPCHQALLIADRAALALGRF